MMIFDKYVIFLQCKLFLAGADGSVAKIIANEICYRLSDFKYSFP